VIGEELIGLCIDDGWLAGGTVLWVLAAWFVQASYGVAPPAACAAFAAGLAVVLATSAIRRARI
jgi:hypothetical protein